MKFGIRCFFFLVALFIDASRFLEIPGVESCPVLFIALATGYALRADALAGGAWGFAGGLSLGLLYSDSTIGVRTLAGLVAGSLPVTVRRLLFWRRWTGQAALAALATILFEGTILVIAWLREDLAGPDLALLLRIVVAAVLTGLSCPVLMRFVERLERRY